MRLILTMTWLCLLVWSVGFVHYVRHIPSTLIHSNAPADVIIVLTGGASRIAEGFDLLAEGRAESLFISGVGEDISTQTLIDNYAKPQHHAMLRDAPIMLDAVARNTRHNARETKRYLQDTGREHVLLVTAHYHMQRSLLEMRRAMPNVAFIAHGVSPAGFDLARWWEAPKTRYLMLAEYHKIWLVRLRYLLGA